MDSFKNGYDNSACNANNDVGSAQISSIEMNHTVDAKMNAVVVTGCCGGGLNANSKHLSDDKSPENGLPDTCQPKCPAVRTSPWDPLKTRFVAVLTIAIVAWLLLGIFLKNM